MRRYWVGAEKQVQKIGIMINKLGIRIESWFFEKDPETAKSWQNMPAGFISWEWTSHSLLWALKLPQMILAEAWQVRAFSIVGHSIHHGTRWWGWWTVKEASDPIRTHQWLIDIFQTLVTSNRKAISNIHAKTMHVWNPCDALASILVVRNLYRE